MKKYMLLLLLFMIPTFINAEEYDVNNRLVYDYYKKISLRESYGSDYYNYLENNYDKLKLSQDIIEKIVINDEYPDYFGGMYISNDSKKLIVQVVKDNISPEKVLEYETYKELILGDNRVNIEYVNNNYKYLNNVNSKIIDLFNKEIKYSHDFVGNYIDIYNNVVVVEIDEESPIDINELKNIYIDTNNIKFIKKSKHVDSLKAGGGIKTKGISNSCSMGFRAKVNGKVGYITAGHCYNNTGESSTGGTVTLRQYGGTIDAAFVKKTGSISLYNTLAYTGNGITALNTVGMTPFLPAGTAVARSGVSSHYKSGTVISNNYSGYWNGVYFTSLVSTNVYVLGGDSGGPVFFPNIINDGATLIGVVKGRDSNNDYSMYFVKEANIMSSFGYSRY